MISWYPTPDLSVGIYLLIFLAAKIRFKPKEKLKEKGKRQQKRMKRKKKKEEIFKKSRVALFISKAVFSLSLSLSSTERLVITASVSAVQTCLN